MHYEINVAWQGKHFFATAERSLTNMDDAADVYSAIVQRFPTEAGFSVTIRRWDCTGRDVAQEVEDYLRRRP